MPARLRVLAEDGRLRTNEEVLVPLSGNMRANVLKRGLVRLISDRAVDPVAKILAFARLVKMDWAAPDCVEWFPYEFTDSAITLVLEWHTKSLKHGLRGDALPEVVHAKAALRYVEGFRGAGMS